MKWVQRRFFLPVLVLGGDHPDRLQHGSIGIAEEPCTPKLGRDLGTPEHIVAAGELLRDLAGEAALGSAGGRHGGAFLWRWKDLDVMEETCSAYHEKLAVSVVPLLRDAPSCL